MPVLMPQVDKFGCLAARPTQRELYAIRLPFAYVTTICRGPTTPNIVLLVGGLIIPVFNLCL